MAWRLLISVAIVPGWSHAQTPSVMDRVQADHVLRVCTTGDYKPYSFLRPDGSYEGMDIDAAGQIAAALGAKAEFVPTTWSTLLDDFAAGKCDLAVGGVSVSLERQKRAGFSIPYLVDGKSAIARCADAQRFASLAEIDQKGVRVIVNPGGTNERFAKANIKQAQVIVYPDNVTIFGEIAEGRADVMITDTSETRVQHKLHPSLCSLNPDKPFQYGEKAYLLPRDDVPFKAFVDQWLHLAQANGSLSRMEDAWMK
ncbi:MAG: transporter substrate-binding domain-containing protein [Burkholderiaceae bacterium]